MITRRGFFASIVSPALLKKGEHILPLEAMPKSPVVYTTIVLDGRKIAEALVPAFTDNMLHRQIFTK